MTWTLRRRLAVTLALTGTLLVGVVVSAVLLLDDVRDRQDDVVVNFYRATTAEQVLLVQALDSETSIRGYAATGDLRFLEPYIEPDSPERTDLQASVRTLLAGEPELLESFNAAQDAESLWYARFAEPLRLAVPQTGPGEARDLLAGKRLFDALRTADGQFRDALIERRAEKLDELQTRTNALFGVVLLAAVVALAVGVVLFVTTRRWVTTPLVQLGEDVRRVRSGDLGHLVVSTGPPELRAVADDVDDMRRSLVERLAEVETAGHEIEAARLRLEDQAEELARSNRDLEQFAYVASHDLQEPLRKVASFCELLQRRYGGELDDRADQYIAFAVDGAKRMQQLINDLLAFSRVGRMAAAEMAVVPLEAALDRATGSLATVIEELGVEVAHDPLPEVRGEPTLLAQLLQNLIGNALKFRAEAPPRVRVTCAEVDGAYELAVVDNGIGIEPQYAEKVFVIFQRLHAKDAYEGTGIGLALCKRIVEHHGGRIWIEPAPGGGTAVRFTLPVPAPVTTEESA